MRKAAVIGLEVLALASLAGAYALEHFTKAKLGMTRWVNYNSAAIKQTVPVDTLFVACAVVLAVLLIAAVVALVRQPKRPASIAAVAFAALWVIGFALAACRIIHTAAYVFTVAALLLGALFALAAAGLTLRKRQTRQAPHCS